MIDADLPGLLRTAAEKHRIILPQKPLRNFRPGGIHAGDEADTLVCHEINSPLYNTLGQLHIGDAIHQDAADIFMLLDHSDGVAPVVELICRGKAGGAGAHHRHLSVRILRRAAAGHLLLLEGPLDDAQLVIVNRYRLAVNAADTGLLAEGRAHPARKLREIVRLEEPAQRMVKVTVHNHVVPLGDQIMEGASEGFALKLHAGLTVRYAAVHTAGPLLHPLFFGNGQIEFVPVLHPLQGRAQFIFLSGILQKTCGFSHSVFPLSYFLATA